MQELDKAIADYTDAIKLDPKHIEAILYRGGCLTLTNNLERAVADYTEVIKLDPKRADAFCSRGYALILLRGTNFMRY
jgi:tetratricopeptide (TPR) repeat protein